jgi:hypothetical protein
MVYCRSLLPNNIHKLHITQSNNFEKKKHLQVLSFSLEIGRNFLHFIGLAVILVIPENKPVFEKITPTQLVKKIPPPYGTQIAVDSQNSLAYPCPQSHDFTQMPLTSFYTLPSACRCSKHSLHIAYVFSYIPLSVDAVTPTCRESGSTRFSSIYCS